MFPGGKAGGRLHYLRSAQTHLIASYTPPVAAVVSFSIGLLAASSTRPRPYAFSARMIDLLSRYWKAASFNADFLAVRVKTSVGRRFKA